MLLAAILQKKKIIRKNMCSKEKNKAENRAVTTSHPELNETSYQKEMKK